MSVNGNYYFLYVFERCHSSSYMFSVLPCHEPEPDNDSADEQDTCDEQDTRHNRQDSCAAKGIQSLTFKVLLLTGGRQPTYVCILFPGLFAEFCIVQRNFDSYKILDVCRTKYHDIL